jgi:hypothetical protein
MPLNPDRLELAILNVAAQASDGQSLQCNYGDLTNRMRHFDAEAANENINLVIDALVSLTSRSLLSLEKFVGEQRVSFDFARQADSTYLKRFLRAWSVWYENFTRGETQTFTTERAVAG